MTFMIGGIVQSPVPQSQTVPSSDPMFPWHNAVPYHCEGCGHVFPCAPRPMGRCGICHGRMVPGYSQVYLDNIDIIEGG